MFIHTGRTLASGAFYIRPTSASLEYGSNEFGTVVWDFGMEWTNIIARHRDKRSQNLREVDNLLAVVAVQTQGPIIRRALEDDEIRNRLRRPP